MYHCMPISRGCNYKNRRDHLRMSEFLVESVNQRVSYLILTLIFFLVKVLCLACDRSLSIGRSQGRPGKRTVPSEEETERQTDRTECCKVRQIRVLPRTCVLLVLHHIHGFFRASCVPSLSCCCGVSFSSEVQRGESRTPGKPCAAFFFHPIKNIPTFVRVVSFFFPPIPPSLSPNQPTTQPPIQNTHSTLWILPAGNC